jgi:hypothetical protein
VLGQPLIAGQTVLLSNEKPAKSGKTTRAGSCQMNKKKQHTIAHGPGPLTKLNPYLAMGGVAIPLEGKRPIHKDWTRRRYSSAKVAAKCAAQGRNVGWRIPENVVVIDIDPRHGANPEVLETFAFEYGIDPLANPRLVRTGGGGWHSFYRIPEGVRVMDTLPDWPGIEFKGKGRQVVAAGSIHPDTKRHYEWAGDPPNDANICDMPEALLRAITRPQSTAVSAGGQLDPEQAAAVLARLTPEDFPTNERWLKLMMSVHHATGGEARQEWIDFSISDPNFRDDAEHIGRRWDSLHTDKSGEPLVTIGTLRHFLSEAGALDALPPDQEQAAEDFEGADDPDFDMEEPAPATEPMRWDMNNANEMLAYAEARMLSGGAQLYQTGGRIVYPVRTQRASTDDDSVRRPAGALTTQDVKPPRLNLFMIEHAPFYRTIKPPRGGEPKKVKHPANRNLAELFIAKSDSWNLPSLTGIIETPTLRSDGTLLTAPGYDRASGLLLDTGSVEFPAIPDRPSREEALAALALVATPFKGFPFVPDGPKDKDGLKTSASRTVMLAAVLTALVRRTLRAAPMHGVSAPTPGTGKTLAIQVVSMIAMGRPLTAMSQGASAEEDERRLFSVLLQGDQIISIDNVTRPIGGNAMCTIMTEQTWQNRILGESRNVQVATNVLFMPTGNNLTFEGDMTRRALLCRMDAGVENPEHRSFDMDLNTWVPANRVKLVVAGLTILRAFVCGGWPGLDRLQAFGGFQDWSNLVRGALVWLGEPDPCLTMRHIAADDPVKAQLAEFFKTVHDAMGDRSFTASELLKEGMDTSGTELTDTIYAVVPNKVNHLTLGHFLKANERKIVGGLSLQRTQDKHSKIWVYRVVVK